MRLSCPNCLTEYEVPDAAIAGRTRTLRCAQCGEQWMHGAVAAPKVAPEIAPPEEAWAPAPPPMPDVPPELEVAQPEALPEPAQEALQESSPEPAFTWATPPAAPAGWPEFTTENASISETVARAFGVPADAEAGAEIQEAVAAEVLPLPEAEPVAETVVEPVAETVAGTETQAASLRLLTDEDFRFAARPPETVSEPDTAEQDSFAALVSAARRKSLEYEPEPAPPPPPVRTSSKPLFFILLILFLIGMAVLERHLIIHLIPASAKLFQGLGLK